MENKKNNFYFAQFISVMDIVKALLAKWYLILIVALVGTAVAGVYTAYGIEPTYNADTTLYVFNKAEGEIGGTVSSSDLTASTDLAETYKVLLTSKKLRNAVIQEVRSNSEYAMLNITPGFLSGAVSIANVNETQIIKITVRTADPELSAAIANAYAAVSPQEMINVTEVGRVNIVDLADVPTAPSSPSMARNCAIGFIIGAMIVAAIVIIRLLLDTVLHDTDDIEKVTEVSIIGSIPSFRTKNTAMKEVSLNIVKGRSIGNEK